MNDALKTLGIVYDEVDKGYTIRENGIEKFYDNLRDAVWSGIFGFCNCEDPDKHLIKMYDMLSGLDGDSPTYLLDEDVIYLSLLDSKGMTEHGCSVHLSWLNDKGRALMKVIKAAVRTEEEENQQKQ